MGASLVGFIPSDMRVRIVREVIGETGIRPLSNAIGVNPKTVYKYKRGIACPTDETMAKILAVVKERYPDLFEKYVGELREGFSAALKAPALKIEAARPPEIRREKIEKKAPRRKIPAPEPEPSEATKFEIFEAIGLSNPADRMSLAKALAVMQGAGTFKREDIARASSLPQAQVNRYIEALLGAGYVERVSRDGYKLLVRIRM